MSIFNDKALKGVAEAVSKIMDEELKGNQHKIDANKNGKVDAHDFKLLRGKKGMKEAAEKMASKDHDGDGKVESGKAEYLGSRIRAAKASGKLKEEVELDEAFPTVADAKKRMDAGKTATGTVTKTKTGLVHKRDYKDDDTDADDTQKKTSGYGARQNTGMRGQSDGTKKSMKEEKLSFTEMLHLYNEHGVEVISKIAPQTVKFGDTEVEVIDANIVNGAVGITVAEEVDNETFTKEVEAQKEKNAGRGKKADVAKPSVQAVEVQKEDAGDPDTKVHLGPGYAVTHSSRVLSGKPAKSKSAVTLHNKSHWQSDSDSRYHHVLNFPKGTKFTQGPSGIHAKHPKIDAPKNKERTKTEPGHGPYGGYSSEHGHHIHSTPENLAAIHKSLREEHEQIDELSKSTLGSYIKKARFSGEHHNWRANVAKAKQDKNSSMKKHDNRIKGIDKAVDRLTKEEVEQIDELSKDTLSMYVKKAHYSGGMADFKHGRIADKRGDSKDKMKLSKISRNRERGINKAVDRLTKKD